MPPERRPVALASVRLAAPSCESRKSSRFHRSTIRNRPSSQRPTDLMTVPPRSSCPSAAARRRKSAKSKPNFRRQARRLARARCRVPIDPRRNYGKACSIRSGTSNGLLFLVIFSILWWFLTFIPFSFLLDGEVPGGPIARLFAPLLLGHLLVFGYTLLYLGDVLITSVAGESVIPAGRPATRTR